MGPASSDSTAVLPGGVRRRGFALDGFLVRLFSAPVFDVALLFYNADRF